MILLDPGCRMFARRRGYLRDTENICETWKIFVGQRKYLQNRQRLSFTSDHGVRVSNLARKIGILFSAKAHCISLILTLILLFMKRNPRWSNEALGPPTVSVQCHHALASHTRHTCCVSLWSCRTSFSRVNLSRLETFRKWNRYIWWPVR